MLFQSFLAHMLAPAQGRVALALIGVAGAMIIDIAFLLDLADHCAAAGMACDQPGKREVMSAALCLLGEAAIQHALHALPKFDRNERLMLALDKLAVPFELSGVKPVAEDRVHRTHRHLRAAPPMD